MSPTITTTDDDVRRALSALSAEVQASLALSRAALQALSALSPTLAGVAERALDDELDLARDSGASQRVVELIEEARDRLQDSADEIAMISALQDALVASADALPDLLDA